MSEIRYVLRSSSPPCRDRACPRSCRVARTIFGKECMTVDLRFRPVLVAFMAVSSVHAAADPACEGLKNLTFDHAAVVTAAFVEAGPVKLPPIVSGNRPDVTVPRHCEVKGVA